MEVPGARPTTGTGNHAGVYREMLSCKSTSTGHILSECHLAQIVDNGHRLLSGDSAVAIMLEAGLGVAMRAPNGEKLYY